MKLTNEEVVRFARQADAHMEAGVEAVEVEAEDLSKMAWELLLLRTRLANTPQRHDAGKTIPGTLKAMKQ